MLETSTYTIAVNLREGSCTISGTQEFVEKNTEKVFSFIQKNYSGHTTHCDTLSSPIGSIHNTGDICDTSLLDEDAHTNQSDKAYSNSAAKYMASGIYSIDPDDDSIMIHRKIPGGNNAEKMKNVALIVLYQKKGKILGSEIRELCEKQGCFDSSNFAKAFDRDIKNFIKKKVSAKKWTLSLTIDGETAAVALLESMVNAK